MDIAANSTLGCMCVNTPFIMVYLCPKAGVSLLSAENSATTKILPVSWALEQTLGISLSLPLAVF